MQHKKTAAVSPFLRTGFTSLKKYDGLYLVMAYWSRLQPSNDTNAGFILSGNCHCTIFTNDVTVKITHYTLIQYLSLTLSKRTRCGVGVNCSMPTATARKDKRQGWRKITTFIYYVAGVGLAAHFLNHENMTNTIAREEQRIYKLNLVDVYILNKLTPGLKNKRF